MSKQKFCANCRHFSPGYFTYGALGHEYLKPAPVCRNPRLGRDNVSGQIAIIPADDCRNHESMCGPDAAWLEEIPAPAPVEESAGVVFLRWIFGVVLLLVVAFLIFRTR